MSSEDLVITSCSLGYLVAGRKVQMCQRLKKSAITSVHPLQKLVELTHPYKFVLPSLTLV